MDKSKRLQEVSKHEGGVDLISNLPDGILLLILSRLNSTEEVIRSSVLSKRWRHLWTAIPSLDLDKGRFEFKENQFKEAVYWVLLNRSVDLDSFHLSCFDDYSMSTVERWIHATVMRNVKQLDLMFSPKLEDDYSMPPIVMPHSLVTCASLEVLRLSSGARLILPSFSGFPALRVLTLDSVELFDDDLVNYFLESCCPLLEDLTLIECRLDKLDLLCISCPNLKKLSIYYWDRNDDADNLCGCLKLSCPKLVSLCFIGQIASNYIVERLYSLKEAIIAPEGNTLHGLLPGISHVESLTIGLHFLYEYIDDARDPALPNLKTLKLTTINATYTFKALIQVLKYCPKLESLSLTVKNGRSHDDSEEYDYLEFPKLDETETRILTPEVKWIEFFEYNGEKPKLNISWYGNIRDWAYVAARWGNKAKYSH